MAWTTEIRRRATLLDASSPTKLANLAGTRKTLDRKIALSGDLIAAVATFDSVGHDGGDCRLI
jgi:hypothetical protein